MLVTIAVVVFPSGDTREVGMSRWGRGNFDFPYCCRYCGEKVPDHDQAFCSRACEDRFNWQRRTDPAGRVTYTIKAEHPFSDLTG